MATVGIIANPASGKDIRRLVAYGTVFDNQEKVNIVRRALLGLASAGVERVLYMPDYYGIVPRAVDGLSSQHRRLPLEVCPLDMELTGTQIDSCRAAQEMNRHGVDCILTMGGDGTNRMVAKGCGEIPLVPVSTGTNNVFPEMVEGTIAGQAAGLAAGGIDGPGAIIRTKKLIIFKCGNPVDIALIDAVVLQDNFIGSRAVWDTERIKQIVVTRGEPHNIGISSIAGNLDPIGMAEARGLAIDFGGDGDGISVLAPIAPGLIRHVKLRGYRSLALKEEVAVRSAPCVIALDGEREVEVREGEAASIRLSPDGPYVVNIKTILRQAVACGFFRREEILRNIIWLKEDH